MELSDDIIEKVKQLQEKYAATGQDLNSYLEGLLYADYVKYWDYIQVDTLLSLQKPRTNFPDEIIFIMYHQVTELYFKLSLHELEQLANKEDLTGEFLTVRLTRVNRYFEALTKSFEIMINGMEREQFLKYRMSLLPASGFQSGQYRKIEIACANFLQLVEKDERHKFSSDYSEEDIPNMFEWIYWKKGATELESGKKTLSLIQFEEKYRDEFIALAKKLKNKNVWALYKGLPEAEQQKEELILALRQLDINVNVNWPLVHYKSAARYLQKDPMDIAATGGTNWQKYLPPRFQKRIFYPLLWSVKEIEDWGKGWVKSVVRDLN